MTHRTLFCRLGAAVLALGLSVAPAVAGQAPPPIPDWAGVTLSDVEAAYALLHDNHPGALPEFADADFRRRLEDGRAAALRRAADVRDAAGHRAVLNGFAAGMGDGHISWRPTASADYLWAGLITARAGEDWRIAFREPSDGRPDLTGARLIDCDGRPGDAFAQERLGGFRIDWQVEAQRIRNAHFLLLDDGNPFLASPARCRFELGGEVVDHAMDWRATPIEQLRETIGRIPRGAPAGMGLRPFAGGYWIALASLGDGASNVVEAVQAEAQALRAAPAVVLDLRGNGGGASSLGRQIAEVLAGEEAVAAVSSAGVCAEVWRASPGNLDGVRAWRGFAAERGPEFSQWLEDSIAGLERAVAAGEPTDRPVPDCPRTRAASEPPELLMSGRLILITDESCFSSCLLVADLFRRLGALHLGHATDRGTRYMEVRDIDLPSGLGRFSTMQKAAIGEAVTGPFAPTVIHPGPMTGDGALEAWVIDQLALEDSGP